MFIPRTVLSEIQGHLDKPEITVILGPRQAGKTTILSRLREEMNQKGKKTLFLSLDNLEEREHFVSQNALLRRIELAFGKSAKGYVFIDEVQRLKDAGVFLKGLYDMGNPHKFVVTGSGSLELKASIAESMVGRKKEFFVHPLSFSEFFAYRSGERPDKIREFFEVRPHEGERVFDEYATYGGYPRVALAETKAEKENILREIYAAYVERDVKALLGIEKDAAYGELVRYLAGTVGGVINRAEISRAAGVSEKTVRQYLDVLEKTYIVRIAHPFHRNITKELTKSPKVYFVDLGLRNYAAQNFQSFHGRVDKGMVFENFVFARLLELNLPFPPKFWRTQAGAEVDFVMERGGEILPVEAKSGDAPRISRGLMSFVRHYAPAEAYVYFAGSGGGEEEKRDGTRIKFVPYYDTIIKN